MTRQEEIFAAFATFHRSNPRLWRAIVARVDDLLYRGATRIGIRLVLEQIRTDPAWRQADAEPFKINNNYNAWYARLLLAARPELANTIECRRQRSALRRATGRLDQADEQLALAELEADPFAGRLQELLS